MFTVMPWLVYGLAGASLWAAVEAEGDPIPGISWPSLGVAGGAIAILLGTLGWLVRDQRKGNWMPREQHDAELARLDAQHARELAAAQTEVVAWRAAHDTLSVTHNATTTALADSIEANRANDRAWDLLTRGVTPAAPRRGHNGTEPAEGLTE